MKRSKKAKLVGSISRERAGTPPSTKVIIPKKGGKYNRNNKHRNKRNDDSGVFYC